MKNTNWDWNNYNIKIKYINNDIRYSHGNVFIPVEEHDNVEITVK